MIRIAILLLVTWDALKVYLGLHEPVVQFLILGPILGLGFLVAFSGAGSNVLVSRPLVVWFLWIAYALFNTFLIVGFDPHRETSATVFVSSILLGPLFAGLLASRKVSTEKVLDVLIVALTIRMLLSALFDDLGQLGTDQYTRLGVDFNSNAIAAGAFFLLVALTIRRRQFRRSWIDAVIATSALGMLVLTASVKFFIALLIFYACVVFCDMTRKATLGRVKKSIVTAWVVLIAALAVLPQTSLVGRTLDKFDRSMRAESSTQLFDNRAAQYILGWQEFVENPINGIGLRNFMNRSGNTAPLHSEYLVQIVENGLIGAMIFLTFWGSMVRMLLRSLRYGPAREIGMLHCCSVGVLLYLYLGIWSYNIPFNWIPIGLALRHVLETRAMAAESQKRRSDAIDAIGRLA